MVCHQITAGEFAKSDSWPGWRNIPAAHKCPHQPPSRGESPERCASARCARRGFLPGVRMRSIAPASAENEAAGVASPFVVRLSQLTDFAKLRINDLGAHFGRDSRVGSPFQARPLKSAPIKALKIGNIMQKAGKMTGRKRTRFSDTVLAYVEALGATLHHPELLLQLADSGIWDELLHEHRLSSRDRSTFCLPEYGAPAARATSRQHYNRRLPTVSKRS